WSRVGGGHAGGRGPDPRGGAAEIAMDERAVSLSRRPGTGGGPGRNRGPGATRGQSVSLERPASKTSEQPGVFWALDRLRRYRHPGRVLHPRPGWHPPELV